MLRLVAQAPIPSNHSMEVLIFALAGLGISIDPSHFIGGMLLAISGSILAARMASGDGNTRRSFWVTLLAGFFVAIIIAELHQVAVTSLVDGSPGEGRFPRLVYGFAITPVQIVMGMAGFASAGLIRMILKFTRQLEHRASDIADKVVDKVLPGDGE